ncbi:MAG: AGE family epimerase/isomerase [Opitutaceae bacterium]|nr:AGE family epimerase/isomerase [Opitutaceae bacterium]
MHDKEGPRKSIGWYFCVPSSPPATDKKIWRAGTFLLHERFGGSEKNPVYWTRFVEQWRFIQNHLIDPRYGGWYREVAADGTLIPGPGSAKGWQWKAAYHETRALLLTIEHPRRLASVVESG